MYVSVRYAIDTTHDSLLQILVEKHLTNHRFSIYSKDYQDRIELQIVASLGAHADQGALSCLQLRPEGTVTDD